MKTAFKLVLMSMIKNIWLQQFPCLLLVAYCAMTVLFRSLSVCCCRLVGEAELGNKFNPGKNLIS
jgi:hypothetical protein